jgi:2-polyprenyl-6-methoxyphenol hydroxylase-like FAD-dependent oxidoreductase
MSTSNPHSNSNFNVIVIGAGLGGLSLAQSLRRTEIHVQIFERDHGPFDRPQGYRLHLDADAINACKEVLSPELNAVFEATAQWTEPYTTILKKDLSVVKRLLTEDDHGDVWPAHEGAPVHANVDRATLRQILLAGLDDCLHYGKSLDRYTSDQTGVTAYFSDGTTVRGNLLVGADGIRSAVRRQRAPHAKTVGAGITAIYGRLPASKAKTLVPTETLEDIFTIASDERKVFLGLGSVRFPTPPDQAAEKLAKGVAMRPQDDYVVCIVGGRHEFFPSGLRDASCETLQRIAAETIEGWSSERASAVIRAGDPSAFFSVEMYTSVPCKLDEPTNVTLLGDAIHAMTPTLGRGANIAMRDGALLGRELKKVAKGSASLNEALAAYERGLLDYGFAVVRQAAEIGEQRMAQNPLPA